MNKDFWKTKLFWLAVIQVSISIAQFLDGVPVSKSIWFILTGVLTIIFNWIGEPGNPLPITPADAARMSWLERAYAWSWFHIEALWIKSEPARRPFTYMMRDFWHQHKIAGWTICLAVTGLIIWGLIYSRWFIPLAAFHFMLFAHLNWGTPYIPNEQEHPQYGKVKDPRNKPISF